MATALRNFMLVLFCKYKDGLDYYMNVRIMANRTYNIEHIASVKGMIRLLPNVMQIFQYFLNSSTPQIWTESNQLLLVLQPLPNRKI